MERLVEAFHIALSNLAHNAVRSLLSILGVVIGIAAVITVLSIGAGARKQIMERIDSLGANVHTVSARYDETTQRIGEFEQEDVRRLSQIPAVMSVLPQLNLFKMVRSRATESRGIITGIQETHLVAKGAVLIKGRNISPVELELRSAVCLLGESAARTLFEGPSESIGQTIYVEDVPYQVIGVFSMGSAGRVKGDVDVWVPLTTLIRNTSNITIRGIEVQVKPDASPSVKEEIIRVLERDDPRRKNLFSVRDIKEFYARSIEMQNTLSVIGALVACISLLVGGIGMMNVMLTSVAERTREIGIRRAVGARKKDILFQFLVESCVLSLIGGLTGLVFGAALARGLPVMFSEFFTVAPLIRPSFVLLAVAAGVALGMAFGFYPAIKASQLSPSEALRTE